MPHGNSSWQLLTLLLILALPAVATLSAAEAKRPPNIVIIVADDLGYGDLGYLGGKDIPTPRIDALAHDSVRFSSGYVSGPYCSPTRAGLLTSRYQQRFGHEFNPGPNAAAGFGLSLEEKTLADRLKAVGYSTGIVGKWHLGNEEKFNPTKRGFDEFFGFLGGAHGYFPEEGGNNPILRGTEVVQESEYLTDAFTREAVSYIDRHKDKPFFLYLTYNAVHNPQHAKKEHLERFASIADERRRTYAGMLTAMDEGIGRVLDKVKDAGLENDTLVTFISDNGGPPANGSTNGPLNGQKATTWEGGIRVPFLIKWPGQLPANQDYSQPVIQLDLGTTVLAAAEAKVDDAQKLDGVNLLPYLKGENKDAPHQSLYWRFGEQIALRKGDWKLLKVRGDEQARLYNLKDDVGEKTDLAARNPELLSELQKEWDTWNATLVKPSWTPGPQQGNHRNQRNQVQSVK